MNRVGENRVASLLAGNHPPDMGQGAFPQYPPEPFQWGAGGQRMTPEAIAQQRALGQSKMAVDASPIGSWTQGLARVLNNLSGGLDVRRARKAEEANQEYSQGLMEQLNGTSPAGGALGGDSSAALGAPDRIARALQIANDPYASQQVRAIAQQQVDQAQWEQRKQMEWANREMPEIVQLSRIANDPNQPEHIRRDAAARVQSMNDPTMVIPGLPSGTYVGPRSGIGAAFGEAPPTGAPTTLPADFDFDAPSADPMQAGEDAAMAGLQNGGVLTRQQERAIRQALGSRADSYMRAHNMRVEN